MSGGDLITVICIAFNHGKWIEKALDSVRLQSHRPKELIVVDNGSTDQSAEIIRDWVHRHSGELQISAVYNLEAKPYCKLFNEMLDSAEGEFVVDLSGDDFLYPQHLALSVNRLKSETQAAFVFSDANILEENGAQESFYSANELSELRHKVLGREFYKMLISRSFISAPTVVFRTEFLKKEGGYDASLSYEDFDIQLRLTSKYPVVFTDHVGVLKRKHAHSLSAHQYQSYQSVMLPSTLRVCGKIKEMNRTAEEDNALVERILFELKHALWSANFKVAKGFVAMAEEMEVNSLEFLLYKLWLALRMDVTWLYVKLA